MWEEGMCTSELLVVGKELILTIHRKTDVNENTCGAQETLSA